MLQLNFSLSHIDFKTSVALKLTQNLLAISKKYESQVKLEGGETLWLISQRTTLYS